MRKKAGPPDPLRTVAKRRLAGEQADMGKTFSTDELLHELQVHQIELEMQNDALRRTQLELEESRDRYRELYDFAPVAYLTLARDGTISDINLTGATLLGLERNTRHRRHFARCVAPQDADRWHLFFANVLQRSGKQTCELLLRGGEASLFHAQVDCQRVGEGAETTVRLALTAIPGQKGREEIIRKLSAAVEQNPASVIITDARGSIEYVNASFSRVSGYAPEEVIGQNPRILRSEEMAAGVFEDLWQSILTGRIWEGELCNRRKDGSLYWEAVIISPLRDPQGKITHFVGVQTDITERKKTEEKLRKFEEQYRVLFDSIQDIFYRTDMDGRIEIISPSCLQQTGYSQQELIGRKVTDFYADPAQRDALLMELSRKGQVNDFDAVLVHKDGSTRVASVTSRLLTGADGKPTGVQGILRDVTARKQSQEKLALSEKRYRFLFEQASDYVLVLESNGNKPPLIVDANQAALDRHGYTAEELLGKPITFLDTSMPEKEMIDRLHQLKSGKRLIFESLHKCKDGSFFHAEVVARQAQVGERSIIFTVERDITARKEAERLQASLLNENRKLIRRLIEVQEEERRMLARELHDELGQLLTAINARAEFIARQAKDETLSSAAADILDATRALFEASHTTRIRLRPASLDSLGLSAALSELADQWKKQTDMDCTLDIEGELDTLDDMQAITIYRMVQEGLTNAHRHGHASHATVTVRHMPARKSKPGQLSVEIDDNGKGLHVTNLNRGMGIIGMRERVVALGGNFHFTGIPGDGVRIEATVPLGRKENDQ